MAPPRYAQQSVNGPYSHLPNHLQSHNPSQQHGILPPPTHLGAPAPFGPGNSASTSPFALAGTTTNGFDRGMGDNSGLLSQSQVAYGRGGNAPAHQLYDTTQNMHTVKEDPRIRNVWRNNLDQEMAHLRAMVDTYPYIAMVLIPSLSDVQLLTLVVFRILNSPV